MDAQVSTIKLYQLNVGFTRVKSPIDGQVGRYMATVGNLVNQDQTLLTTVQSLDPMYVDFYMDEATRLKIINRIREGKITLPAGGGMPILMGLQDEPGYPHKAILTFMNNQINPTTGSILMRAIFNNPKLSAETGHGHGEQGRESRARRPRRQDFSTGHGGKARRQARRVRGTAGGAGSPLPNTGPATSAGLPTSADR